MTSYDIICHHMPSSTCLGCCPFLILKVKCFKDYSSLPFWYGQEDVGRQTISLWVHTCEIKSYIPSNKCTYIVDCCKPILLSPRMEVPSLPMTLLGIVPPPKPLVIRPFSVTGGEAPSKISVGTRNGAMI